MSTLLKKEKDPFLKTMKMTKKKTTLAEYGGLADLAAARQGRGAQADPTRASDRRQAQFRRLHDAQGSAVWPRTGQAASGKGGGITTDNADDLIDRLVDMTVEARDRLIEALQAAGIDSTHKHCWR